MTSSPAVAILVVESDREIGASLTEQLVADGYRVRLARTAEHARCLANAEPPTLALIGELEAPRATLQLLTEIRSAPGSDPVWDARLPVVLLGALHEEPDLIRAFEAGADDVVARRASYLELRARVRALLRRLNAAEGAGALHVGELRIDLNSRAVWVHGRAVELRRLEFDLLVHLAREPRRVCPRAELLREVWGFRADTSTRTLDSHASRLRCKLGPGAESPWVVGVRGVGYRLI